MIEYRLYTFPNYYEIWKCDTDTQTLFGCYSTYDQAMFDVSMEKGLIYVAPYIF